ncbi:hypothetical protein FGG08_003212 [Glutinoglossum americanum]|uniref:Cyclin-dependent kinase n=1 Tax=Glutinoglossum americanum TaxID=1670608 RepID=A0A9P8IDN7_9PEZI|nr:hypothetical protein FGG08_003212 [Glutinoglossum americanum]
MSSPITKQQSDDVAEKVLRRAEIAKMGRLLKSRLALASFKAKNGWEHLPLKTVEPLAERELKRKRPHSSGEMVSDSSSTISDYHRPSVLNFKPPSTVHLLPDDIYRHGSRHNYKKRIINKSSLQYPGPNRGARKRANSISSTLPKSQASLATWKGVHHLPQSSPVHHRQYSQLTVSHGASISFTSEAPTVPTEAFSPSFAAVSDDEESDLHMHSFQVPPSQICSSPPRTPPPSRSRPGRLRGANKSTLASHDPQTGKEGADLLLYLAGSPPSSVNPVMKTRVFAPATPPSRSLVLPSSMMTTPTGLLGGFGGPSTPSQFFDFSDFVNITPSPGQQQWGSRTPHILRTPLAAKEARRKLNFDALVPPSASPNLGGLGGEGKKRISLGSQMQLGGELVP